MTPCLTVETRSRDSCLAAKIRERLGLPWSLTAKFFTSPESPECDAGGLISWIHSPRIPDAKILRWNGCIESSRWYPLDPDAGFLEIHGNTLSFPQKNEHRFRGVSLEKGFAALCETIFSDTSLWHWPDDASFQDTPEQRFQIDETDADCLGAQEFHPGRPPDTELWGRIWKGLPCPAGNPDFFSKGSLRQANFLNRPSGKRQIELHTGKLGFYAGMPCRIQDEDWIIMEAIHSIDLIGNIIGQGAPFPYQISLILSPVDSSIDTLPPCPLHRSLLTASPSRLERYGRFLSHGNAEFGSEDHGKRETSWFLRTGQGLTLKMDDQANQIRISCSPFHFNLDQGQGRVEISVSEGPHLHWEEKPQILETTVPGSPTIHMEKKSPLLRLLWNNAPWFQLDEQGNQRLSLPGSLDMKSQGVSLLADDVNFFSPKDLSLKSDGDCHINVNLIHLN
ncbi:MAG TPA: hypothetical protein VLM37_10915 [Fibrobacteraceae bacterium]|nr:hypothetical protein [Fibrobacteraceae bacterium]